MNTTKKNSTTDENQRKAEDKTDLLPQKKNSLTSKWEEIRHHFMIKYNELTEADVTHGERPEDFEAMLERMHKKTGRSISQLRHEIESWDPSHNKGD